MNGHEGGGGNAAPKRKDGGVWGMGVCRGRGKVVERGKKGGGLLAFSQNDKT